MKNFVLFTSIPPKLSRKANGSEVGREYQRKCVDSWRNAGFSIVSVNPPTEVDAIRGMDLPLEVLSCSDSRPPLREVLRAASITAADLCAIVNADCLFIGYENAAKKISSKSGDTLFIAERVDIEFDARSPLAGNCGGFDAFFFRPGIVEDVEETKFRIGDPWWDYWLPCELACKGYSIDRLATPLLMHLSHLTRWSRKDWHDCGEYFREQLVRQICSPDCSSDFKQRFANLNVADIDLPTLGPFVHEWLRSRRSEGDIYFLNELDTSPEQLLRSLRDYHSVESVKKIDYLKARTKALDSSSEAIETLLAVFDDADGSTIVFDRSPTADLIMWPIEMFRHRPIGAMLAVVVLSLLLALSVFALPSLGVPGLSWIVAALVVMATMSLILLSYLKGKIGRLVHQIAVVRPQLQRLRNITRPPVVTMTPQPFVD